MAHNYINYMEIHAVFHRGPAILFVTPACCLSILSSLLPNIPCLEGLSSGRPHLCMQAFCLTGCDGCGPWQKDLQEGAAQQGQLQSLDIDLQGVAGRRGRASLVLACHLGLLGR